MREYLPTAVLAICRSAKVEPTLVNRRKARQTLYKWARARAKSDWPGLLIQHLDFVCCSASLLGLPLTEWQYNAAGEKWPALKWPHKRNIDAQRATFNEWNRIAQKQMTALWEWFDRSGHND